MCGEVVFKVGEVFCGILRGLNEGQIGITLIVHV